MNKKDLKDIMADPERGRAVVESLIYSDPANRNSDLNNLSSSVKETLGNNIHVETSNGKTTIIGDKYVIEYKELG